MFSMVKFLLLPVIALAVTAPANEQKPFTILPASEAQNTTTLCSRESLTTIDGGWQPDATTVEAAESQLQQLSQPSSSAETIPSPTTFFRQYVGVIVSGRKLIYLNALANERVAWREKFLKTCGGGSGFWGAIYDPATRKFSDLHKNGPL
jgi:hypothetical protein